MRTNYSGKSCEALRPAWYGIVHRRRDSVSKTMIGIARKRATIMVMQIAIFAMRTLELMFFVGLAGSTVVVLISFIEDGKELFGKDED